jgi:hypothetical protein
MTDLTIRLVAPPICRHLYAVHRVGRHLRPAIATAIEILQDAAATLARATAVPPPGASARSATTGQI